MKKKLPPETIRFDTGISMAEYADTPAGMNASMRQKTLLPGSTTVSQALANIFPEEDSIAGEIMSALISGNSAFLRTPHGFNLTARKVLKDLRAKKIRAALEAADELEILLADTEVYEQYARSIVES